MPGTKLDILAEILKITQEGATKTRIVAQANLNQKLATPTLNLLVDLDLLAKTQNSPISYSTTKKGLKFLHKYSRLQRLFDSKYELQQTL